MANLILQLAFKLLLILEEETNWINSTEIGDLLGVSYKTIQNEVRTLNNLMPNGWNISVQSGLGYQLTQPYSESVKYRFIDEEILLFCEVLSLILNRRVSNLTELADQLYISVSAAQKLIRDINKITIKSYNLNISDRPLRIKGKEDIIRTLMYDKNYFLNATFNDHEYYLLEKKEFDLFINVNLRVTISLYNKNAFYTFLDVTVQRIRDGYESDGIPKVLMEETLSTDLYQRIEPLFAFIEDYYNVKLSKKERSILYFAFMRTDFHLIESYDPNFFNNKKYKEFNSSFLKFVDYLREEFNLNFNKSSKFMINAFNLYYLNYYVIDLLNVLYSLDYVALEGRDHFDNALNNHQLPLEEFTELCHKWGEENDVRFSKHFIISMIILIQEFNLTFAKIDILVVKSYSFVLNNLLITELKREMGQKVNFLKYEPSSIRSFEHFKNNVDFILSDIILPKELLTIPHIFISESITNKKLKTIKKTINDVISEKEKLTIKVPIQK